MTESTFCCSDFWNKLCFPTYDSFGYSLSEVFESVHLVLTSHHRQTQVLFKVYHYLGIKHVFDILPHLQPSVGAKE